MPHMDRVSAYTGRARELRRRLTRQEKRLWYDFLQKYPIRWYKQRNIAVYIVDFYCARAHLVVEIDGSQHYTEDNAAYDAERTAFLQQYQLQVLRFTNQDIERRFAAVCQMIDQTVQENLRKYEGFPGV